jgi:ribosomal protein S18 acetylase RimI-like enzyme
MKQCVSHLRSRKVRARRLWVAVEQRNQVIARAFLTHMGFHHTSTIRDLLSDQDVLVYVYSFD